MTRDWISACAAAAALLALSSTASFAATGKCQSISAQCAVEIGGTCDPATGRWRYGGYGGQYSGGTNRSGAFDQCVARKLKGGGR
jgi:hypothetical protein